MPAVIVGSPEKNCLHITVESKTLA